MTLPPTPLAALIEQELDAEQPPAAAVRFTELLLERHGDNVRAILFYGACRRSGEADGILDFYVVVERYRALHRTLLGTFPTWLLPPTVTFSQLPEEGAGSAAAKIAYVSARDFEARMRVQSVDTSFWARFSQPVTLLYAADPAARAWVVSALETACRTAVAVAKRVAPKAQASRDLWARLFTFTYRTELRPEGRERPESIYDRNSSWYDGILAAVAADRKPRAGWSLANTLLGPGMRIAAGKCLAFLRLVKGAFTFEGAVDYVIWKIERHNGVRVVLTPWQHRHPVLASPLILIKLLRLGAIR